MPRYLQPLLPAVFLALLALAVIIGGKRFDAGTLAQMGPGFTPLLLGVILFLLALLLAASEWPAVAALRAAEPTVHAGSRIPLRPIVCASLSLVLWALVAERFGFIPAALGQLLLANAALPGTNWIRVGIGSFVVAALAYTLFVLVLGMPLKAVGF